MDCWHPRARPYGAREAAHYVTASIAGIWDFTAGLTWRQPPCHTLPPCPVSDAVDGIDRMKAPQTTRRTVDAATGSYWATVQLLDGSQVSGLITEEDHSGVRLYRLERRDADGGAIVEYFGFISVSCMLPGKLPHAATGEHAVSL
jgi:hypothetical protein